MLETVKLAKSHGIAVGAHPGLPDLLGFGRRAMNITPEDAYAYVVYQTATAPPAVVDAEPRKPTACPFSGKGGDASACPAAGGKVVG